MKRFNVLFWAALCGGLSLSSCSEEVINDSMEGELSHDKPSGMLRVQTRGGGDAPDVSAGRLYIFNQDASSCLQIINTEAETQSADVILSPGTYQIYAVGGDLNKFDLPENLEDITTTSTIAPKTDQNGDLLMCHTEVTMTEGQTKNQPLNLERKVFKIEKISVHQVPDDIIKIEVTISNLYNEVKLNGTYPSGTSTPSFTLTKKENGDWEALLNQYSFPSSVAPTITVKFFNAEKAVPYSYVAEAPIPANVKLNINATFSTNMLSATLIGAEWNADKNISFNFNNTNNVPQANSKYGGFYVVSVDATNRKAVILSKVSSAFNYSSDLATLSANIESAMSKASKPDIAATNDHWRLPTIEECQIFSKDSKAISFLGNGNSSKYYCMDGSTLKWGQSIKNGDNYDFTSGTDLPNGITLRPVIDIDY